MCTYAMYMYRYMYMGCSKATGSEELLRQKHPGRDPQCGGPAPEEQYKGLLSFFFREAWRPIRTRL